MATILTSEDVDKFLLSMRKSGCPWCGSESWGLHTVQQKEFAADEPGRYDDPEVRALPRLRMAVKPDGTLHGAVSIGTQVSLAAVVVECLNCTHLSTFNYFSMVQRIEELRQHGNHPPS